jgi:hypothetical protein
MIQQKKTLPVYKDVSLFLVLIPCINFLNYYLTYDHIQFNWQLLGCIEYRQPRQYHRYAKSKCVILCG